MNNAHELDARFDNLTDFIKTCDKSTYPEHWKAVEEYVRRAAFIVFNFDRPIEKLKAQLDREQQAVLAFDRMVAASSGT